MLGKRLVDRSDKLDRSGYRQRQWGDGELLVPAWRKTVIYGGEIAVVLYSSAEGVWSGGGGIDPPVWERYGRIFCQTWRRKDAYAGLMLNGNCI